MKYTNQQNSYDDVAFVVENFDEFLQKKILGNQKP